MEIYVNYAIPLSNGHFTASRPCKRPLTPLLQRSWKMAAWLPGVMLQQVATLTWGKP